MSDEPEEHEQEQYRRIGALSGVNQRGEGFVHLSMEHGPQREKAILQATPEEARRIGHQITEAADAAESDSFLFQFLTTKLEQPRHAAAAILVEFRKFRQLSGGVKDAQENAEHWEELMKRNAEKKPPPADPTKK